MQWDMRRGRHLRRFPGIGFGTEVYPERIARRLRALNLTTWIASPLAAGYAVAQFFDRTPGLWQVATVNALTALILAALPLLHRFGPLVAPIAFTLTAYVTVFADCYLLGIGSGMQFYYLALAAVTVLFLGTEYLFLSAVLASAAAALIIALETLVPRNTGLQSAQITFVEFIITTVAASAILFSVVRYAVREAEREHNRSEALLTNILPAAIAERLKRGKEMVIADKYDEVSILFVDIADFTAGASQTTPEELVLFLNRVFTDFDRLVERHGLEKIKTTGDAYMVVSGVPTPRSDHAEALAQLALDMRDAAKDLRDPFGRSLAIRIGMSSGPVVAGVVGARKFFYDVWGDAVNLASRMESTGVSGQIQVSQEIYQHLKDRFVLMSRGEIAIKGKGGVRTWFLVGRKTPAAKALPLF
ncbi:adenylate/guanylate cyclase domain-containing protein [Mesorhizobium sp.]|uniref:adenylate/guanylate cyclase domain-containing protein n=1 Tax=Mesorhizobium sp. TaxID=1871066 RepID=UPI00338D6BDF